MNAVVCAVLIALLVPANTVGVHDNDTSSVLHLLTQLPPGDVANSLLPAAELAVDKINAFLYLHFCTQFFEWGELLLFVSSYFQQCAIGEMGLDSVISHEFGACHTVCVSSYHARITRWFNEYFPVILCLFYLFFPTEQKSWNSSLLKYIAISLWGVCQLCLTFPPLPALTFFTFLYHLVVSRQP